MPNKNTFSMAPVKRLIGRVMYENPGLWVDPFSRNSPFAGQCLTNDINPQFPADYHMEALDFLQTFSDCSADGVLFDPPYSPRQIQECYGGIGRKVHQSDTQSSFYGQRKNEVARILKPGGIAVCFGWNSGGLGASRSMEMLEILMVPHGGAHNDTIITVERKQSLF